MAINLAGYLYSDNGTAVSSADVTLVASDASTEATTTTNGSGYWSFAEADEDVYDIKIQSGSQIRYLKGSDKLSVAEIDVRNSAAATTPAFTFSNTTNSASNQVGRFRSLNTTRADGDEIYLSFNLVNDNAEETEFARITAEANDVSNGSEDGEIRFSVMKAGTLTEVWNLNSSTAGATSLDINADSFTIGAGGDTDITLTFDANTADGVITWMEDEDYFKFSDDILMNSTEKIQFYDTGIYIYSSTDGQLDLVADTEIQIAATTIDINGAVALDGAITGATNITLSGELDAATLDISGAVDIDGATDIGGTLTLGTVAAAGTDTDKFLVLDGSGNVDYRTGTQVLSDIGASSGNPVLDDIGTGDAASTLATSAGNITIDAQGNDTDIIFKGTDATSDITMLTLDGSEAGAATFNSTVTATGFTIGNAAIVETELETIDGITAGTAAANKAVVLDGSKNIATIGTIGSGAITSTGTSSFGTGTTIGNLTLANGSITDSGGALDFGNETLTTNVADIALDSISADGTDINVAVSDNSATALTIKQGSDAYLIVDTANSSESVSIGTGISGTAITLGHGTSEVTVGDNLTVTGNLTVSGATTTVTSTTVAVADAMLLVAKDQGTSADAVDFGIYGKYGVGGTAKYAGIFRDQSATGDPWTFFDGNQAEPGTTVDTGGTGYDLAPISVGAITAADASTFSSTISAATGSTIGNLTLANGSITDSGGTISFGDENISTTGTATLSTVDIGAGAINGTAIGASSASTIVGTTIDAGTDFTIGDTVITDGTITDTSGLTIAAAVDLGSNTLTTTGSLQVRTIDYSDGDNAITIADGGGTTFAAAVDLGSNTLTSTGSMQIRTIDYSDGDLAMTIADGGAVTFAQAATFSSGIAEAGTISEGTWNADKITTSYITELLGGTLTWTLKTNQVVFLDNMHETFYNSNTNNTDFVTTTTYDGITPTNTCIFHWVNMKGTFSSPTITSDLGSNEAATKIDASLNSSAVDSGYQKMWYHKSPTLGDINYSLTTGGGNSADGCHCVILLANVDQTNLIKTQPWDNATYASNDTDTWSTFNYNYYNELRADGMPMFEMNPGDLYVSHLAGSSVMYSISANMWRVGGVGGGWGEWRNSDVHIAGYRGGQFLNNFKTQTYYENLGNAQYYLGIDAVIQSPQTKLVLFDGVADYTIKLNQIYIANPEVNGTMVDIDVTGLVSGGTDFLHSNGSTALVETTSATTAGAYGEQVATTTICKGAMAYSDRLHPLLTRPIYLPENAGLSAKATNIHPFNPFNQRTVDVIVDFEVIGDA